MQKMVFIYTRPYNSDKHEYENYREYSLGLVDASGAMQDALTKLTLTAENYCKMCLDNDPLCCPVVVNVEKKPTNKEEWNMLTKEINNRFLAVARIKELLNSLLPPFDEPFSINIK